MRKATCVSLDPKFVDLLDSIRERRISRSRLLENLAYDSLTRRWLNGDE